MKINRKLLPVKGTYFCVLGGVASLLPYLGVYMKQIGLSAAESAIIYGTMPFLGAFMRMLVGGIADKLQKHQVALLICCLLSGVFHGFLLLVPSRAAPANVIDLSLSCTPSSVAVSLDVCLAGSCLNTDLFGNASCDVTCCPAQHLCFGDLCLSNSSSQLCETFHVSRLVKDSFSYGDHNESCVSYVPSESIRYGEQVYSSLGCSSEINAQCSVSCDEVIPCVEVPPTEKYERTFWMFFIVCLIGQMFFAPIFSLVDAMTYDFLGAEYEKWGLQRLWGTVGFGAFAVACGLIMDVYNTGTEGKDYTFSFIAFAVLNILASALVFLYKISSNFQCKQIFKNMGALMRNVNVLLLMLAMFIFGSYTGLIEVFLFWHLSMIGGTQLLNGLCILVNCIPEAFVLIFAGSIIQKIGHVTCLHIAMLAYGVRLLAYSLLSEPWWVLSIEPLQAVCFGLMYAAASSYANMITPQGMSGTVQGIIGALYFGAGKGFGSVVGGIIFENFGAVITFRAYGISAFIFFVAFVLIHRFVIVPRQKDEESKKGVSHHHANQCFNSLKGKYCRIWWSRIN
ncbi:hypothetical protein CAPTEDRAFT_106629 [Capitella teleta]|uniref:Major facilitator superfamily (MFS) profile domain-containing protein n=1 Tax=Capitella teleta TaxID=283909 RepID=R7VE62_CAPTE|nr:hypothetical protein CAPTEDRAFT_106629 [Capitella teleta]|eukprot:ELU16919.1 hypothetical protein CAPTEDRAFT_106629 [Capitella teleta]